MERASRIRVNACPPRTSSERLRAAYVGARSRPGATAPMPHLNAGGDDGWEGSVISRLSGLVAGWLNAKKTVFPRDPSRNGASLSGFALATSPRADGGFPLERVVRGVSAPFLSFSRGDPPGGPLRNPHRAPTLPTSDNRGPWPWSRSVVMECGQQRLVDVLSVVGLSGWPVTV
jgi:hypothetical protein